MKAALIRSGLLMLVISIILGTCFFRQQMAGLSAAPRTGAGFSASVTAINFYFNTNPAVYVSGAAQNVTATVEITVTTQGQYCPPPPSWTVTIKRGEVEVTTVNFTYPGPYSNSNVIISLPSAAAAYDYTASLTSGTGSPAPVTKTAYVVGIASPLEYQVAGDYYPVPANLRVAKGATVTFKAIRDPSSAPAWPSGKPVWGGTSGATGTGETKAVTFNTAGSCTVTAECGNTETANVTVVEVEKIQYDSGGENYIDVPDPLRIPKGATITFKAILNPAGGWPSGKPVWGGTSGASGTGETKAVTFDTADSYTVTAECGNTVTANIIVVELQKIQYNKSGIYADVPDPLRVAKGAMVTFKAIPNPTGDWPTGKPEWGGTAGATGTGETKAITFNTSGSFTVSAECGNTITVNIYVCYIDLQAKGHDFANPKSAGVSISEDDEESPGAYIHYNLDSDNGTDTHDVTIITTAIANEDDLLRIDMVGDIPTSGSLILERTGNIIIWKSATKGFINIVLLDLNNISWDLSVVAERNAFLALQTSGLYVEGYATGNASIKLTLKDGEGVEMDYDTVNYHIIAAECGAQPTFAERDDFTTWSTGLVNCEWSKTGNATTAYNCIAWSVGETTSWYYKEDIDIYFGNNDGHFTVDDMDEFYWAKKGWDPNATDASDAEAMYYASYHAAVRKAGCTCGAGQWYIFESKCGDDMRVEHVWNQLTGYGAPSRFYK